MGYKLRREVRDALPPGLLTAAERLLVLEVADACSDTTREGWPGADALAELADLSPRSIQEALNRIGKKWIELRVPLGKDTSGRPYYSHAGRRTTFRFPPLPRRQGAMNPGASEGATDAGASGSEGATDPGGRCDGSVPKVRQIRAEGATDPGAFSSMNHSVPLISLPASPPVDASRSADPPPAGERDEDSLEPEPQDARHRFVMRHGATADEAARVVADIQAEHRPRGNGWWRKVDQEGDLGDIVAQALTRLRATASKPAQNQQPARPLHCGSCDPNRLVWIRSPAGRVGLAPCPTCHQRGKPLPDGSTVVSGPDGQSQPARPDRADPACGRPGCRDGWYRLGINKVRCHVCPDPHQQEIECAS